MKKEENAKPESPGEEVSDENKKVNNAELGEKQIEPDAQGTQNDENKKGEVPGQDEKEKDDFKKQKAEWEAELARRQKELDEKEADFERKKSAMVTNVQQEEQDMRKVIAFIFEFSRIYVYRIKHKIFLP